MISFVVPCMGRLEHLKQTLPSLLGHTQGNVMLVDWSCPDRCGDWAEETLSPKYPGRLEVVHVTGETTFHKARALNLGHRFAIRRWDAPMCATIDADTLVLPGFWDSVKDLPGDRFYFFEWTEEFRDLSGFILMASRDFDGYEERCVGWGIEDIELRCRMHLLQGLDYQKICNGLPYLSPILHDDAVRTAHHAEKNPLMAHTKNARVLLENLRTWGIPLDRLPIAKLKDLGFNVEVREKS